MSLKDVLPKTVSERDALAITINLFQDLKKKYDKLKTVVEDLAACEDHMEGCPAKTHLQSSDTVCDCFDHRHYNYENMIELARKALKEIE